MFGQAHQLPLKSPKDEGSRGGSRGTVGRGELRRQRALVMLRDPSPVVAADRNRGPAERLSPPRRFRAHRPLGLCRDWGGSPDSPQRSVKAVCRTLWSLPVVVISHRILPEPVRGRIGPLEVAGVFKS